MTAHGLTVDEEKDIVYGNMWLNSGEKAYDQLFTDPEHYPQAVVCANDYSAIGMMRTLRKKGLRVPEDVIVTGFDNIPSIDLTDPLLTTVEQDFAGLATAALDELDRQMREPDKVWEPREKRMIPIGGKLIIGESCGCGCRDDQFYMRISTERTREADNMAGREVCMTYLTIELNACDDLKELHRVLDRKKNDTPAVRDFYLCLFEKGRDENGNPLFAQEMTDTACLVHAMRDRQDHGMPMISFDRKDLLPAMAERIDEPQVFFLMLLHQREDAFGYTMFHYMPGEVPSNF